MLQTFAHLPAAHPSSYTAHALRARFAQPPYLQAAWTPELRTEPPFAAQVKPSTTPHSADETPPTVNAAVLMGIVHRPSGIEGKDNATIILTQRPTHLRAHAGQIAFPGGKMDAQDADATACALREAHEEVGLSQEFVAVLGELPSYTTGLGYHVVPVLALVSPEHRIDINPEEVAECFEIPLDYLMNPAHHRQHEALVQGSLRRWYSMPYRDGAGTERYVWGISALLLRNLYRFLRAVPQ